MLDNARQFDYVGHMLSNGSNELKAAQQAYAPDVGVTAAPRMSKSLFASPFTYLALSAARVFGRPKYFSG
jgi:hypothetical protein